MKWKNKHTTEKRLARLYAEIENIIFQREVETYDLWLPVAREWLHAGILGMTDKYGHVEEIVDKDELGWSECLEVKDFDALKAMKATIEAAFPYIEKMEDKYWEELDEQDLGEWEE